MPPENSAGNTPMEGMSGLSTIDALDKRTRAYKRYTAIREAVLEDLGGEDHLSEVQKQLVASSARWRCSSRRRRLRPWRARRSMRRASAGPPGICGGSLKRSACSGERAT